MPGQIRQRPRPRSGRARLLRRGRYHERPQEHGLELEPSELFHYIYPLSRDTLANLVCFFEDEARTIGASTQAPASTAATREARAFADPGPLRTKVSAPWMRASSSLFTSARV